MNEEYTMKETYEQQMKDSDMIFNAISSGSFRNFDEAERMVVLGYVMDKAVSRSGISHALNRLEKHYSQANSGERNDNTRTHR